MSSSALAGLKILVAEDEYYFAADLAEELQAAGATIDGPFTTVAEAIAGLDGQDVVILDVKLSGERSDALASLLGDKGIPFIVVTGYADAALPDALRGAPRLTKPCSSAEVVEAVAGLDLGRN